MNEKEISYEDYLKQKKDNLESENPIKSPSYEAYLNSDMGVLDYRNAKMDAWISGFKKGVRESLSNYLKTLRKLYIKRLMSNGISINEAIELLEIPEEDKQEIITFFK